RLRARSGGLVRSLPHSVLAPRDPRSLPTRRSSDLQPVARVPADLGRHLLQGLHQGAQDQGHQTAKAHAAPQVVLIARLELFQQPDRKSTRLNSSHVKISYAVCCLKKEMQRQDLGVS